MLELPDSLWAATAPPGPRCPPLDADESADVVVIGAGYTGLSAALHLAEAGKSVRVLDAGEPGWGCSGRNGGQVNPGGTRVLPAEIIAALGRERGERMIRMGDATCDLVFDLIERHAIDCDALRPGYVQAGYGAQGLRSLEAWARQWGDYGVEIDLLDRRALQDLLGSGEYQHGIFDPRGGNIQPLSYARGLARAAQGLGAHIHGGTRATAISRDGAGWRVEASQGIVHGEFVLVCTNGYTDELWPSLREAVVPVCSFVAATKPLGHNVLSTILPGRHAVSETCRVIVYYRLDGDGRFVIGGRGNWFDLDETGDDAHVRARAAEIFPALADVEWEYHWGGYPAMTLNHLPKLFELASGAYAGLGYNGRGVGTATMMGKQLADAVLGEPTEMTVEPLKPIPFHRLRQTGVSYRLLTGTGLDWWDQRAS